MKSLIVSVVAVLALSGCATLGTGSAGEKLIIQAATMKVIEADEDRSAKAAKIRAAVDQARVWLDVGGITLADLRYAMLARIGGLEPSDRLLATALIDAVAVELEARIGDGILDADKRVRVNAVLSWIAEAASFYG